MPPASAGFDENPRQDENVYARCDIPRQGKPAKVYYPMREIPG